MSDFESFSASESANQGSSAETFRLFQERMKVAAAQIKAIKAGEQKQKKKEDELAKILSEFLQKHQNDSELTEFIVHITNLLARNTPAVFVLSLILLNFPELQNQTGLQLLTFEEAAKAGALENPTLPDIYLKNSTLPLQVKIAIDGWLQGISEAANQARHKLISPIQPIPEILDCASFSIQFYLNKLEIPTDPTMLRQFTEFCLKNIFEQLKKPIPEIGDLSK